MTYHLNEALELYLNEQEALNGIDIVTSGDGKVEDTSQPYRGIIEDRPSQMWNRIDYPTGKRNRKK
jgi:hypothetical protein